MTIGTGIEPLEERRRRRMLGDAADAGAVALLEDLGVSLGWRCLAVGAVSETLAAWLVETVGPEGTVVVADSTAEMLPHVGGTQPVVHDHTRRPLAPGGFDLVVARQALLCAPDAPAALGHLAASVAEGGALVVEEPDYGVLSAADPDHPDARRFARAIAELLEFSEARAGVHLRQGRELPRWFELLGLQHVSHTARSSIVEGASAASQLLRMTVELVDRAAGAGRGNRPLEDRARWFNDPSFAFIDALAVCCWGWRPVSD
ncbi:MAG: methyltransferase domain-containing protein [Acidimicrobiales bacterium]